MFKIDTDVPWPGRTEQEDELFELLKIMRPGESVFVPRHLVPTYVLQQMTDVVRDGFGSFGSKAFSISYRGEITDGYVFYGARIWRMK